MERCLMNNLPYEIMFEIFRGLSKRKLIRISRLCSKFRSIAGDTRLWKNVHIKYEPSNPNKVSIVENIAFEELYSEPWPVKAIYLEVYLSRAWINPPVSSQTDQIVRVNKLHLSSYAADTVTLKAILAKYQCTELYWDTTCHDYDGIIMEIAPEVFSKQTNLELLAVGALFRPHVMAQYSLWLQQVLSNCKKLKILYLNCARMDSFHMLSLCKNLPTTLEKMFSLNVCPEDSFFKSMAVSAPNLKGLELCSSKVNCPSLLKFEFLEVLYLVWHCWPYPCRNFKINNLYMSLIKFPALKIVYMGSYYRSLYYSKIDLENLQTLLEPHDIVVRPFEKSEQSHSGDGNLWRVSFPLDSN